MINAGVLEKGAEKNLWAQEGGNKGDWRKLHSD
jgi:hypothetical protein